MDKEVKQLVKNLTERGHKVKRMVTVLIVPQEMSIEDARKEIERKK